MPAIRVRAALAVIHKGRILLVPHYDTDAGPVQWTIPGGRLVFGEGLRADLVYHPPTTVVRALGMTEL